MKKLLNILISFSSFIKLIIKRRSLIVEMAKRDIAVHYMGSVLGFFWAIINPLFMVLILWLVFSVGFKSAPKSDVPFVVWLTAGMAIWNAFTEMINGSTGTIVDNRHLVKKVVFPLSILPVVKLVGSYITHAIYLLLLVVLMVLHGMFPSFWWFQALYYLAAMSVLALGIGWMTASVNVIARDVGPVVGVLLQFGFWGTPIFWDTAIMPPSIQPLFKLNPMYYIVQGYRDSFIYSVPFWHHWQLTLYFWVVTLVIFGIGALIFVKLRPHFADVM